jgi:hypothetical protein
VRRAAFVYFISAAILAALYAFLLARAKPGQVSHALWIVGVVGIFLQGRYILTGARAARQWSLFTSACYVLIFTALAGGLLLKPGFARVFSLPGNWWLALIGSSVLAGLHGYAVVLLTYRPKGP